MYVFLNILGKNSTYNSNIRRFGRVESQISFSIRFVHGNTCQLLFTLIFKQNQLNSFVFFLETYAQCRFAQVCNCINKSAFVFAVFN